ncbi:MAG: alpha/beta hydrolase [Betaproteobacteria bacterium]
MTVRKRDFAADLRGVGRMAIDATLGITDLVEALHVRIARVPVHLGGPAGAAVASVTEGVYRSIRGVTRAVGGGLDAMLARLVPLVGGIPDASSREALVAALNGVLGDYLERTANPLAIPMRLNRGGAALELSRKALLARMPSASSTVVVAVHGLCMSDRQWSRDGHDLVETLARAVGGDALTLHYNSGLHVSDNGRRFAALLDALGRAWPVPIARLVVIGHSMGGLVARSAAHCGEAAGHRWRDALESLVFLGTPHQGSPLERGGHGIDVLLEALPVAAPFARLGRVRSAGITDLRHGSVLEEDWAGRDRFARGAPTRHPLPLPADVACYAIAGSLSASVREDGRGARGDGLVPVASALGFHANPRFALGFAASHRWIAPLTGHLALLASTAVEARLRVWMSEKPSARAAMA